MTHESSLKTHLSPKEIELMDQRKRAHLINSLGGFKSVCLIGTQDKLGNTNLTIFSSIVHLGANPPLISFIVRPDSVDRHTLTNIEETKHYTINHIRENFFRKAHQTSARYEKELSEFEATGLTPIYQNNFPAPFVKESNIQIGMRKEQKIVLEINKTIMVIGEIQEIYFPSECWEADGFLDLECAGTITCSGLDSYHKTLRIDRLSYAKPNMEVKSMPKTKIGSVN